MRSERTFGGSLHKITNSSITYQISYALFLSLGFKPQTLSNQVYTKRVMGFGLYHCLIQNVV
jgi:hypothetical protein